MVLSLWLLCVVLVHSAAELSVSELTYEVHVPEKPCDGFVCSDLAAAKGDGRGSCPLRVSAVLGFTGGGQEASMFLPMRKGGAGQCQTLEVESVGGALGSRVASFELRNRTIGGGEVVGLDVKVVFDSGAMRELFVNVTFVCGGGLWHYTLFNEHEAVAHVYRVGLMLFSQSDAVPVAMARVLFPFDLSREQVFADAVIPSVNRSGGSTVFRFDAAFVYSFSLTFAFDSSAYLQCSDESLFHVVVVKYGLIGGAIVGGIAVCAALAWFIVKRVIKKKVEPPSFELLGDQIDVLTDGENSPSEAESM
jgi:hypothetical protein